MKFSDFSAEVWKENGRFYDTCLIPFTGLQGTESPLETVAALERMRNFMDIVEMPFQGRIVTYPAVQYMGAGYKALINEICHKVKSNQFQYVIVLTADIRLSGKEIIESDLVLSLPEIEVPQGGRLSGVVREKIQQMWQT